eukprot:456432-Rhodomonas_salina.1
MIVDGAPHFLVIAVERIPAGHEVCHGASYRTMIICCRPMLLPCGIIFPYVITPCPICPRYFFSHSGVALCCRRRFSPVVIALCYGLCPMLSPYAR